MRNDDEIMNDYVNKTVIDFVARIRKWLVAIMTICIILLWQGNLNRVWVLTLLAFCGIIACSYYIIKWVTVIGLSIYWTIKKMKED